MNFVEFLFLILFMYLSTCLLRSIIGLSINSYFAQNIKTEKEFQKYINFQPKHFVFNFESWHIWTKKETFNYYIKGNK